MLELVHLEENEGIYEYIEAVYSHGLDLRAYTRVYRKLRIKRRIFSITQTYVSVYEHEIPIKN